MRHMRAVALGILLCGVTLGSTTLAQEVQSDSARKVANMVRPGYPSLARAMHLEGSVKLRVTVAPNGSVKSIEAVGGHPVLVQAAEEVVYKWTWTRAKEESKEIVELKFHLN